MARSAGNKEKDIESLKHREARRKNIPTTELESLVSEDEQAPKPIRWKRNTDLDPQLVWRGKDEQDTEDLMVDSVPIYIQEKIQPEAIIRDLLPVLPSRCAAPFLDCCRRSGAHGGAGAAMGGAAGLPTSRPTRRGGA
jgi:hypothetical protein